MNRITENRRINLDAESKARGGDARLAQAIGKSENQIYQWLRASSSTQRRNISDKVARGIEPLLEKPPGWLDEDHSTEAAVPEAPSREFDEAVFQSLPFSRLHGDIAQLRALLLNAIDVIAARQPGVAGALLERMVEVPEDYGERGFHARVTSTVRSISETEAAASRASLPHAARGSSGKKRAP